MARLTKRQSNIRMGYANLAGFSNLSDYRKWQSSQIRKEVRRLKKSGKI